MDFSARKQSLEVRRTELAGVLSHAGLAPAAELRGAGTGTGIEAGSALASRAAVPARAGLEELRRIDAALARLREGSYGYCQICGDDMGDDWLDQRPASPFCKSCAL